MILLVGSLASASAMGPPFTCWQELVRITHGQNRGVEPIELVTEDQALAPRKPAAFRSVTALVLREMATTYGRSPGGYLWAVLEPVAAIALLSFAFSLAFQAPSLGTSFPLFYATAYLPYMLFHDVSAKTAQAIRFSRPLLNFNAVSWFDVVLARFALNMFTHLVVGTLVIGTMLWAFETRAAPDMAVVFAALAMVASLALAVGILNAFLFLAFPAWERLWTIVTRPLFIISGVFFLFEDVPPDVRDFLWFNPLFHVTGFMRSGFYAGYEASYVSEVYVLAISATLLGFGLLLLARHSDGLLQK